jgi:hypothetical protein
LPVSFFAVTFGGIIVNGIICGALSAVNDRYQARVIWLIPLTAVVIVAKLALPSPKGHRLA